ncbi:MAG TPA: peptidylprolyl isomerase [Rhodothermales bacterium]|nr:peptidylprolyl isomerase [Rhodothermales bacterium]
MMQRARLYIASRWLWAAWLMLVGGLNIHCGQPPAEEDYVARVGPSTLSESELTASLENLPERLDSAEARKQFIDQWVTNELLYQEALRSDLRSDPDVQQRLLESERSVLVDALISRLYEQEPPTIMKGEIRSYFERYRERLRLREPFVRVYYLTTPSEADAAEVHQHIQSASFQAVADSLWPDKARQYGDDVEGAISLASNFFPESRLFTDQPVLREQVMRLQPGQTAPLIEDDEVWHVLQVAERVPAGTLPELPWIESDIHRRLALDARKQMYERQVQRLRTEALSRNALDVR